MSILDVIGPVIVGPSSSHTAGAAKIGKFCHNYLGGLPDSVEFILHGSFGSTYFGHGTDKALVGGILGFDVSDLRIKNSFEIAKELNLKYSFSSDDLGDVHPNTVRVILEKNNSLYKIEAASIGAGEILITEIDGVKVNLSGKSPTLVIINKDEHGSLSSILNIISSTGINVANLSLTRISLILEEATCVIELDDIPEKCLIERLKQSEFVISCRYISKI
ncbi:L-serine dehydratase, iron-sulfur-dependent subunit beta [Tepiditoga spiralis]|uniref:L-serine dehydratase n=1 Tax=Tepiditoga spiralis TaxID=2108365 RepID=A0A7G1G6B2_9BACT|nr:L-serine ammonia-lyase, iron-sulfur-dependent subunit beta [Tepiditoga spiralis]BBE32098.1 L-serine dehydratase, iron-sulfur-dependent subunit beta [Tepiditoga spiralis]